MTPIANKYLKSPDNSDKFLKNMQKSLHLDGLN